MISPRISFKNFKSKKVKSSLVRKKLTTLIKEKNLNSKSDQSQSKKDFEDLLLDKIKQN